jgi:hypothetical protein
MYEPIHPAAKPVVEGLEKHELIFAASQPQYNPLRALRSKTFSSEVMSRWSPNDEQRKAIAAGADIFLTLLTFGGPLQPIIMAVSDGPNPDYIRETFQLEK